MRKKEVETNKNHKGVYRIRYCAGEGRNGGRGKVAVEYRDVPWSLLLGT